MKTMSLYQRLIRNVLYPLDLWRTGDYAEYTYWKEFERTQYLPADELRELAWSRLRRILDRAYRKIPYYKASLDRAGIVPSDVKSDEDMLALPILEKRDLQAHLDELVDPDWPKSDLIPDKTGGSTGTPVKYYYSRDRKCSRAAGAVRHDRWTGFEVGNRLAALWGAARDMPPPGWKQRLRGLVFPATLLLNTAHMTSENMLRFNEQMKRYRPTTILAYANAMTIYAAFLKSSGVKVYTPTSIICSAEVLLPEDRKLIESVFGAPVFNRLGCRELSLIASECERHDGLHLMAEGLHVEILRGGRHAEPGEPGEMIVTDLLNDPMPLIRYRLGDTAAWQAGTCACGRHLPRLTEIAGRVTDFLVGMSGELCSGAALTALIVSHRPSLGQIQIIQDEREKILYRVGRGKDNTLSPDDLDYLRTQTELYLGKGIGIEFEYVDTIPHETSGKFAFSKSKVAREYFDSL